jgi:hypothetical protein
VSPRGQAGVIGMGDVKGAARLVGSSHLERHATEWERRPLPGVEAYSNPEPFRAEPDNRVRRFPSAPRRIRCQVERLLHVCAGYPGGRFHAAPGPAPARACTR